MNAKDEIDRTEQLQRELSPVVTVPAPGGELTIELSKHLPEAERLARAESMLHGMIEATEDALENPRPCVSNELLTRPSQLAQGVSDVARRHEHETRHKETLERIINLETLLTGREEPNAELEKDLAPDKIKTDAIKYCARLVCHVWNTGEHGGKRKTADYVFVKAKEGESLFSDCQYARTLVAKWGISVGGIMTVAAKIHAEQSGGKHIKADGMERPETMHETAKKSRAAERAERERKAKQGARQSGKKR